MLLATMLSNARGVIDIETQTTYGALGPRFPRARAGGLDFAAVLADRDAPYNRATYERVVILMSGGFAD